MSRPADFRGARWPVVVIVFTLLGIVLPLGSYPLAILPREWAAQRFDFHFSWAALAVAALLLGAAFLRLELPASLTKARGWVAAPLAVLLSQVVSTLASESSSGVIDALFRTATGVFLCLVAARFLNTRGLRAVAIAWAAAAAVEAVVMLLQAVSHAEPVGMAGNRNFAACFLALSLPIGVACAMTWDGERRPFARWIAVSYATLLLAAMLVSDSRGAVLALALVTAVGWLSRRSRRTRWATMSAGVFVVAGLMLLPPVQTAATRLWNTDVRPMIWLGAARTVADAPWVGHGPGSFARVYPAHRPPEYFDRPKCARATDHAHNEFLEIAVESGVPGVLAFLSLLAVTARAARRAMSRGDESLRPVIAGVTMGWGVLVLQNLVDINLFMPPNDLLFWLMTGWLLSAGFAVAGDTVAAPVVLARPMVRLAAGAAGAWVLAVGVVQPACANWLFREGAIARSAGRERPALECFQRVTEMDPERMEAWRQAGLAAHALGNLNLAVAAFREAHRLMPDYADLNGELGSLLAMKGDFAEAARWLTRSTRLFPRDPASFVKLALVKQSLKEPEAAQRAFEEARRLDPNHPLVRLMEKRFNPPESGRVAP